MPSVPPSHSSVSSAGSRRRSDGNFWRRQFAAHTTRAQVAFDCVFGVLGPLLFLELGGRVLFPRAFEVLRAFFFLQVLLLAIAIHGARTWSQHRTAEPSKTLARARAIQCGALGTMVAFALYFSVTLGPFVFFSWLSSVLFLSAAAMDLWRLVVGLDHGLAGLKDALASFALFLAPPTPFLCVFIYWRNGYRLALRAGKQLQDEFALFAMLGFACVAGSSAWMYFASRNYVRGAVETLEQRPLHREAALAGLARWRWALPSGWTVEQGLRASEGPVRAAWNDASVVLTGMSLQAYSRAHGD